MAFNTADFKFGLDLRQAAVWQVDFLQAVDKRPELQEGQAVQYAIQRYEKLWLPLAAKYPDRLLPAPVDIEWIWHCHLLNPIAYQKDCRRVVGKVVDHRLLDRERRKQSLQESRVLWRHEYPSVPFEADGPISPWFDSDFVSKITYDLAAAVARQRVFFYQVSLPHYKDEKFLSQGVLRYKKFLHLKKKHPNTFIVPCYDIDLIWHTHMLHPQSYHHDMVAILSHLFNHDDSVNDRQAGSKLTVSDAHTRHLWKKTFEENFPQSGAMFRGEPPAGKLFCMDAGDFASLVTKQTTVLLESAQLTGLPEQTQGQYKLKLWYNTGYQNFNRALYVSDSIATVRCNPRHTTNEIRVNANFTFDTKYNDVVMVDLMQKSGRFCLGATEEIGSAQLRMLEKIQALGNGRGVTTRDEVDFGDGVRVQLHWSVAPPTPGGCILALKSGTYQDCIMPETVESMWGPVPLPRLPPGVDNKCSVASHSLLNHTKKVVFTVRMVHSLPLMMSAVLVYYKDKMAAVGHLVGADQLPLPVLVKHPERCVTLDMKKGERAVLLKNHAGDWGIVLGHWTGMRKPVPGKPASATSSGHRGIPGDPGHLEIRFFKFSSRRWTSLSFERNYSGSENKFQIEHATVELDSGLIEISAEASSEVAENLALAFSVALLHVLCQPRPKDWDPSTEDQDEVDAELPRPKRRLPAEGLALIMAAGFLTLVPSNHLLRKRHREALEAQAAEEAMRRQREEEEEEERRRENGSVAGAWGGGDREDYGQDSSDTASASDSGTHDVVALVSAEQNDGDVVEAASAKPATPGEEAEVVSPESATGIDSTKGESSAGDLPGDLPTGLPGLQSNIGAHSYHRHLSIEDAVTLPQIDEKDELPSSDNLQSLDTDIDNDLPLPPPPPPLNSLDFPELNNHLGVLENGLDHIPLTENGAGAMDGPMALRADVPVKAEFGHGGEHRVNGDIVHMNGHLSSEHSDQLSSELQDSSGQNTSGVNGPVDNHVDDSTSPHDQSQLSSAELSSLENTLGDDPVSSDAAGCDHHHDDVAVGFPEHANDSAVGYDHHAEGSAAGFDDLTENGAVGFADHAGDHAVGFDDFLDNGEHLNVDELNDYLFSDLPNGGQLPGPDHDDADFGAGNFNDPGSDIPPDDFNHMYEADHHGDADFTGQQNDDFVAGGHDDDFAYTGKDEAFDMYNGYEVPDFYANDSNYISYEDTHNYDFYSGDGDLGGGSCGGGGDSAGVMFSSYEGGFGDGGSGFDGGGGGGDTGDGGGGGGFSLFDFGGGGGGGGEGGGDGGGAGCGGGGGGCGGCGG